MEDVKLELEHTTNDKQIPLNTKTMTYFGEDDDNNEEINLTWDDGTTDDDDEEEDSDDDAESFEDSTTDFNSLCCDIIGTPTSECDLLWCGAWRC